MHSTSVSLLDRLTDAADSAAWERLHAVYSPLIRGWLKRHGLRTDDADDVVQEVLLVVVRRFPEFQHNTRAGAFRAWLRTIAVNCCRSHWKSNKLRPIGAGGDDFGGYLDQLADPASEQSGAWDREHDLFVTKHLLEMIRPQFEPTTWEAFQRFALRGETAATVAKDLGITSNAVFIAKSRVLSKLREEAAGLVDS